MIEQLGGYDKAKEMYITQLKAGLAPYGYEEALLEYRRANNIYEVGDKVVSTLDGDEDWKNAVCEILAFHKKMAITTGFSCAIHHYDYRHATDAEIKAGRRL